ncbi:cell division control protein Cdc6 [Haloferax sp. Atlit-4N]|uniref:orc1/cdc6 family replication initiation protein n=1 Tax=Haloferax sp. Atlit-4N TaxID=2077206 RepID=UPI000E21EF71|nr:orc1/cdc6 family replication initiation protein [Haloferax sp. Atlit-4N]RDZ49571.1 cell division control protein Cdc6 [Haloferax sp. Atlit-4N]
MPIFTPSTGIFDDPHVLSEEYVPENILGRSHELQEYKNALQPIMDGQPTKSILLYGKTGVGKTVSTKYLLSHLKADVKEYRDMELTTVWVLCENVNTSYQLAASIINSLRGPENHIRPTGYPAEDMYQMMYRELDALGGHVVIVLDEVDNLQADDKLLYELPRARANGRIENVRVTVIGISNDLKFKDNLRQKVKSSLAQQELLFPPYDANQLREILYARADEAFQDDVLTDGVIPLCAAFAAQDIGDARQALMLLREAGNIAKKKDAAEVTEQHVQRARDELEQDLITTSVSKLTTQGKLVLASTLSLHLGDETPARNKDVYSRYKQYASLADAEPVSQRRLRDHLGDLSMQTLLDERTRNTGRQEGRFKEYSVAIDAQAAVTHLQTDGRMEQVVADLENRL